MMNHFIILILFNPCVFFNLEVTITTKGFLDLEVTLTTKGFLDLEVMITTKGFF